MSIFTSIKKIGKSPQEKRRIEIDSKVKPILIEMFGKSWMSIGYSEATLDMSILKDYLDGKSSPEELKASINRIKLECEKTLKEKTGMPNRQTTREQLIDTIKMCESVWKFL